jgi:hypothetical protein
MNTATSAQGMDARALATKLREDLRTRILVARMSYKKADEAIKRTMSLMPISAGRKPKLSLSLDDLTAHMQLREQRARAQHQLQLMVPLERVIRIRLQYGVVNKEAPTSRLFVEIARISTLPGATQLAHEILTKHSEFFGSHPLRLPDATNGAELQKADALLQKLRDSGMLQEDDLRTLNKVFDRYARMLRK